MKLRNQILTALILSGLLPLAIAFLYAIWHSSNITSKLSLDTAEERLEVAAEKLSAYFESRLVEIEILSRNTQVRNMDFQLMRPYLIENLEYKNKYYEKFIIGRTDGSFHNTAGGNPHNNMLRTFDDKSKNAKPKSIKKRDYWQYTVGNNSANLKRLYISNPMISYTTEVKQVVVTSSIINNQSKVVGLLGGSLPWNNIQNIIHELENYLYKGFSGHSKLALISKDGTYWYHWDPDKVIHLARDQKGDFILGSNGEKQTIKTNILNSNFDEIKNSAVSIINGEQALITVGNRNEKSHHIFKHVHSSGYILQLSIPDSVLSAPTLSLTKILFGVFIFASVIAIALTLLISKHLTSPLLNFTSSVGDINHGNLNKVDISSSTYEFNRLVDTFNQMIQTIKHHEESLSDSEERFSLAMQGANDGLWDWNIITNEVYYSHRWKQMLGYTDEELENNLHTWESLVYKDDLLSIQNSINNYVEGKSKSLDQEYRMTHKDGHIVNIHTRGTLTRTESGKAARMVGTNIDISARKEYETQLHELNTTLENRVKIRTQELQNFNKELLLALDNAENAIQVKGNFLSNMSHEIRTPMNGIIGLADLTLRTTLDEKQSDYIHKLKASAITLLNILNDVLDFSKIEAGKLDIESASFNFTSTIESIIDGFIIKAKEKNIDLKVDISDEISTNVIGDKFRMTQILTNITGNAVKFTEQGSISIKITKDEKRGFIHFYITDTGIGIEKEVQSNLFKSFTQADNSSSRSYGGTGLGLAISKHLIKMMRGSINLESTPGKGTCIDFSVYLPADTSVLSIEHKYTAEQNNSNSDISSNLIGKKTLFVEDVEINQIISNEYFTQAGMLVSIASNGKQAVEMAMKTHYDLIIMDIHMPEMDGYEATRLIRRMDEYKDTPIIALTANDDIKNSEKLRLMTGMTAHISKQLDPKKLISEIEKYYS